MFKVKRTMLALLVISLAIVGCSTSENADALPSLDKLPTVAKTQFSPSLTPFTNNVYRISGVVPDDWIEEEYGMYKRKDPQDQTSILQISLPGIKARDLALMMGQELEEYKKIASYESPILVWQIYSTEIQDAGKIYKVVWAQAENDARAFGIMLIAQSEEYEMLYQTIFLPAVAELRPVDEIQSTDIGWKESNSSHLGVKGIVPKNWIDPLQSGLYQRDFFPDSPMILQRCLANTNQREWAQDTLASLGIKVALPTSNGEYKSAVFNWNLYRFDAHDQTGPKSVALALTEKENIACQVVLLGHPDEAQMLYENVFLPVLDGLHPTNIHPASGFSCQFEWVTFTNEYLGTSGIAPGTWGMIVPAEDEPDIFRWIAAFDCQDDINRTHYDSTNLQALNVQELIKGGPLLIQGGKLGLTIESLSETILPVLGIELPQEFISIETEHLTWFIYTSQDKISDTIFINSIALAETDKGAYLIVLSALPSEHSQLYELVFMSALRAFQLTP